MREYYGETARETEMYFSNENNKTATRSEEEIVITLFFAIAPLAASEFKRKFGKPYTMVCPAVRYYV
jgi:hypothetical protein